MSLMECDYCGFQTAFFKKYKKFELKIAPLTEGEKKFASSILGTV